MPEPQPPAGYYDFIKNHLERQQKAQDDVLAELRAGHAGIIERLHNLEIKFNGRVTRLEECPLRIDRIERDIRGLRAMVAVASAVSAAIAGFVTWLILWLKSRP